MAKLQPRIVRADLELRTRLGLATLKKLLRELLVDAELIDAEFRVNQLELNVVQAPGPKRRKPGK